MAEIIKAFDNKQTVEWVNDSILKVSLQIDFTHKI